MTSTFLISLLITAAVSTAAGYFLASCAMYRSIEDDLAELDSERRALDEERAMLTHYWTLDVQPPVVEDLGSHKRVKLEVLS